MSVPSALTGILSLGPAYGLQLHAELGARLSHRASTNVGQIYSTLDRLVRDGLVARQGETSDGLPLYGLTTSGRTSVQQWLTGEWVTAKTPWTEIMDVLLLSVTLPRHSTAQLCVRLESVFTPVAPTESNLGLTAEHNFSSAVLATVAAVRASERNGTLPTAGLSNVRPPRGRRPAQTK